MIVKADGTLVAREDPAPAPPARGCDRCDDRAGPDRSADLHRHGRCRRAATDLASAPAAEETLPIANAPAEEPALAPASKPAEEAAAPTDPQPQAKQSSVSPQKAPVAPARPADQPVNVVGEVKADKVAGACSCRSRSRRKLAMQIASQPTEEAAKASYQDLSRRYGAVLEGRQVSVVKAEIAGKGTFWRVRVAAGSRNEAVNLCEKLQGRRRQLLRVEVGFFGTLKSAGAVPRVGVSMSSPASGRVPYRRSLDDHSTLISLQNRKGGKVPP